MMMNEEEWREIEGYEGYYLISNYGRVYSLRSGGKFLTQTPTSRGYPSVTLCKDGVRKNKTVHRLVTKAFLADSDLPVNHIDGDKTNNALDNLEYISSHENSLHYYRDVDGRKRGIRLHRGAWEACIRNKCEREYLGRFKYKEQAYQAYRKRYIELYNKEPWAVNEN